MIAFERNKTIHVKALFETSSIVSYCCCLSCSYSHAFTIQSRNPSIKYIYFFCTVPTVLKQKKSEKVLPARFYRIA